MGWDDQVAKVEQVAGGNLMRVRVVREIKTVLRARVIICATNPCKFKI